MNDVAILDDNEKIFLAGCIESMILADGMIDTSETDELEKILTELNFSDYENALTEFEKKFTSSNFFWEEAGKITSEETQSLILDTLSEFISLKIYADEAEINLLDKLKSLWRK